MVKVSVIIPVFNTEKYLRECLDSILAQTLEDIEIICVNDGSLDDSPEILQEYEEKYSQVRVMAQVNRGQAAARNAALKIACGKYIYFMDSDDLLTSMALQELWDICEDRQLDILYFSGAAFFETRELAETHRSLAEMYYRSGICTDVLAGPQMLVKLSENKSYEVSPCLQLLNRDFLVRNGLFFCENIIYEDNIFTFKSILKAERTFYVSDVYFYKRVRDGSRMMQEENWQNLKGYFTCLMEQMRFTGESDQDDIDVNKAIDSVLSGLNKQIRNTCQKLPAREIRLFEQHCSNYERHIFHVLVRETILAEQRGKKTDEKYKEEILKIKSSRSYRLGRMFTAPFRLIKGGLKCCRQHGTAYTCRLFVKKVRKKLGGKQNA